MGKEKKISAVIFDCDGVMFDSKMANVNFYNHMLDHFGLPLMDEEEIAFVHMATGTESVKHIFRKTEFFEEAEKYRLQMKYSPFIKDMIIEPGLKKLLKYLRINYRLAIATNRSNTINEVLEKNELTEFFEIVVSSLDVKYPKPHPEALFKILNFFDLHKTEVAYIGDSRVDYETAEAANVPFIAFRGNTLKTPYKVENMEEVPAVLKDMVNQI
jgi:phosphoglycolate phosphatase